MLDCCCCRSIRQHFFRWKNIFTFIEERLNRVQILCSCRSCCWWRWVRRWFIRRWRCRLGRIWLGALQNDQPLHFFDKVVFFTNVSIGGGIQKWGDLNNQDAFINPCTRNQRIHMISDDLDGSPSPWPFTYHHRGTFFFGDGIFTMLLVFCEKKFF